MVVQTKTEESQERGFRALETSATIKYRKANAEKFSSSG